MSKLFDEARDLLWIACLVVFVGTSVWLGFKVTTQDISCDFSPMRSTQLVGYRIEDVAIAAKAADTTCAILQREGFDRGSVKPWLGQSISLADRFSQLTVLRGQIRPFHEQMVNARTRGDSSSVFQEALPFVRDMNMFRTYYVWHFNMYAHHSLAMILWIISLLGVIRLTLELEKA